MLSYKNYFLILGFLILCSCGKRKANLGSHSSLTGWNFNDKKQGDFRINKNYLGQKTPPGMVLVEGGTFTMGSLQDDIMGDWDTSPKKMQIRSFYMDEAEVTNAEYTFYLKWLFKVFPPSNENFKNIYRSALPDTLVWRNVLGNNDPLKNAYLRHPAYANYPVVGVSWLQANAYCTWRTDRINERILIKKGILKELFDKNGKKKKLKEGEEEQKEIELIGVNNFNTELYFRNPTALFGGDTTIYNQKALKTRDGFHIKSEDGIMMPAIRLPTEAEWEYAAKSITENREYNNLTDRKKYPWSGRSTRSQTRRGEQLANFKQGRGDYSGLAGWSNDGADITNVIMSYEPNDFGLYDMAGNVAEWVYDIYEPRIDNDFNDFNYTRGNTFKQIVKEEGGQFVINSNDLQYKTLPNGKIVPIQLPGSIKEKVITNGSKEAGFTYTQPNDINIVENDSTAMNPNAIVESYKTKNRVYKGGSWKDREFWLDPAQRRYLPEFMSTDFIGFRCATDRIGGASTRTPIPISGARR